MREKPPSARHASKDDPRAPTLQFLCKRLADRIYCPAVHVQRLRQNRGRERFVRNEEQCLECARFRHRVAHPRHATSISPNVAACCISTLPSRYNSSRARNLTTTWIRSSQSETISLNVAARPNR